jgi:hypothetical protein
MQSLSQVERGLVDGRPTGSNRAGSRGTRLCSSARGEGRACDQGFRQSPAAALQTVSVTMAVTW